MMIIIYESQKYGFVATTLSISDPIGRLQKGVLVRGEGFEVKEWMDMLGLSSVKT